VLSNANFYHVLFFWGVFRPGTTSVIAKVGASVCALKIFLWMKNYD
jgi:hypothetical protein